MFSCTRALGELRIVHSIAIALYYNIPRILIIVIVLKVFCLIKSGPVLVEEGPEAVGHSVMSCLERGRT